MLSVTCHIAPHLSVFTSRCSILLGSRGGGPDAWQCGPEPAQPDDGVTSVWPVVSVSMLRSSDGHQCHNNMCSPLTSVTSDIMISSQKAPVSGCQAPATWCEPMWWWALLSGAGQAGEPRTGTTNLYFYFPLLSAQVSSSETVRN